MINVFNTLCPSVSKFFKVNKESYVILPTSLDPGQDLRFSLTVYSDKFVRLTSIGEKKTIKCPVGLTNPLSLSLFFLLTIFYRENGKEI